MASIRKRGNLQWEARIRRKGMPTTCKTFDTKADAEKWAREIEAEMDRGAFVSRTEVESTTLYEDIERYISEYLPKLAHYENNLYKARLIQRSNLAKKLMAAIRGKDIADYIKEREQTGISGNTIRLDLAMISRLFNVAISDWGMESLSNPVARVSRPKVAKGSERRLEHDEEDRLLSVVSPEMGLIIKSALETAMRREEISSLLWSNVDLNRRTATLYDTKNGETRTVPLSPKAVETLEAQAAILKSNSIAVGNTIQTKAKAFTQSPSAITQAMRKACKAADIVGLTFHDLRHEATSRLFENTNLDIMEIRAITGHKSLQMLARYTHLRMDRLADRLAGSGRGATK